MRRINRRLVLLLIVLVCDVVSVFGRPQEQNTASSQLKDEHVNRYTAFTTATPRSLESVESYSSTSKNQYASSVVDKTEDTRYAEPDPSLRPFFQFLLNSKKRKKRNLTRSPDSRIVEDFINYSINSLREHPVRAASFDSVVLLHDNGVAQQYHHSSHAPEPDTRYMPVPIYTKVPRPKPLEYDPAPPSGSVSGSISYYQTSTSDPYKQWQETPLIFPDSDKKPPRTTTRPPFISSDYYYHRPPGYNDDIPVLVNNNQSPTFVTPVQLRPPAFVTPVEYQGPTFVTPISVTQAPLSDGNPPPTIVILEDIDTAAEPPQSDPVVEQDPIGGAGGGSVGVGAAAAAAAGAAGITSVVGGAAGAGIVGIAGGVAATVTGGGAGGGAGGAGGGGGTTLTPADVAQCRAGGGGSASKVCSELITTSSSSDDSISFLDGITSLFSSFNFIGPLMITFWSMIFPPMSIILTSGLGVVSLLFPWILPRLWFGRQSRHSFNMERFDQRSDGANSYYHQPYYYY